MGLGGRLFAENVFALHFDVCDVVSRILALRECVSAWDSPGRGWCVVG
jgi:hypothetical protein